MGVFLGGALSAGKKRDRKREKERAMETTGSTGCSPHQHALIVPRVSPHIRQPLVSSLCPAVVRVVCLVVHHQLIVHKVEAVGLRLVRVQDHLPDCERTQTHQGFCSFFGSQIHIFLTVNCSHSVGLFTFNVSPSSGQTVTPSCTLVYDYIFDKLVTRLQPHLYFVFDSAYTGDAQYRFFS